MLIELILFTAFSFISYKLFVYIARNRDLIKQNDYLHSILERQNEVNLDYATTNQLIEEMKMRPNLKFILLIDQSHPTEQNSFSFNMEMIVSRLTPNQIGGMLATSTDIFENRYHRPEDT